MDVVLSPAELMLAVHIASMRRAQNLKLGRQPTYGLTRKDPEWDFDISGAAAEMAVAKALNYYYSGSIGNLEATDAGPFDVRSTVHKNGSLIIHDRDADKRIMVLAIGKDLRWHLAGWLLASEGKDKRWWREDTGRPAYFVPQSALRAMSDWRAAL